MRTRRPRAPCRTVRRGRSPWRAPPKTSPAAAVRSAFSTSKCPPGYLRHRFSFGPQGEARFHARARPRTALIFSTAAGRADDRLHVAEVAFERLATGGGQAILGLGRAPVEIFFADDVLRLFQLARVHAQVSVRRVQELFEVVEGE